MLLIGALFSKSNGSNPNAKSTSNHPFSPSANLYLNAKASRADDGRIIISGDTNLPEGFKLWITVERGKLPKGAPKPVAFDEVFVKDGQVTTKPMWMEVPNTKFSKDHWSQKVKVDVREDLFPPEAFDVRFQAFLNGAWQSDAVLNLIGGEGGKSLKGKIIKASDPDVVDSSKEIDYRQKLDFPAVTPEAQAISVVRSTVMTVPEKGRSKGDVQAVVDLFMGGFGLEPGKGWSAKQNGPSTYLVSYDFIDGNMGEAQAIWSVELKSNSVKYVNEKGKIFSWAPPQ